jgi:succinyl-CoA synthetase beta subunit
MDLMEYMARDHFAAHGLPVPAGAVAETPDAAEALEVPYPAVVKAQVRAGGRGKAGGIRPAADPAEARAAAEAILGMQIKGHVAERVLVVERVEAAREFYLAVLLDRGRKAPTAIFSAEGGVEIEETARARPGAIHRCPIDPLVGLAPYVSRYLLGRAGLAPELFEPFHAVLERLYAAFREGDCLLAEINPLMLSAEGRFVCADAKVTIDDSALAIRHRDLLEARDALETEPLVLEARRHGFLFVPVDEAGGDLAVMSNGSGMLMASMDALQREGLALRCVLDLGGGATAGRIAEAVRLLLGPAGATGLFVNIFGGITRCDEIAGGIRDALATLPADRLLVVRMEGTNREEGRAILEALPSERVALVDRLSEAAGVVRARRERA